MSLYRRLRYNLLKLRGLQGSPQSLALGCGIGVFAGIMPVVPLRSGLILLLAVPARANLLAAFVVGHTVANPFVVALWYFLALACGNRLVTSGVSWDRVQAVMDQIQGSAGLSGSLSALANVGGDIILVLLAGGSVMALPAGVATYFLALRYFAGRAQLTTAADSSENSAG
ncbi:MAG: DUF2062 domain-containing protein [Halieaceae bacterium]|jgi:uncharacterized protein (DUF2062 family)|nr:DUF2062 domain-containing protein [Halieaceae bacterium]